MDVDLIQGACDRPTPGFFFYEPCVCVVSSFAYLPPSTSCLSDLVLFFYETF